MISQLTLTVVDSVTKAPLPDVIISMRSIVTGAIVATQRTDGTGKTIFSIDEGVWRYSAFKGGYTGKLDGLYLTYPRAGYQIELITQPSTTQPPTQGAPQPPTLPSKPGEALPLPDKHEIVGTYGNRCDLLNNYTFAHSFYAHRDRYTGAISRYTSDLPTARAAAESDTNCYLPAPPTQADWQTGIQTQISEAFQALTKYLDDGIKGVADSWKLDILDLEARLKAWIQDNIISKLDILTKGLSDLAAKVETIAANRLKELTDLEARLKTWISGNILELLLLKLLEK